MKPEKALEALRYWESRGLLKGVSDNPPSFEFLNVRSAMQAAAIRTRPTATGTSTASWRNSR
jgi:hypothetical protein